MKKKSVGVLSKILIYAFLLLLIAVVVVPSFVYIGENGHPIGIILPILLYVFIGFLPSRMEKATRMIASEASKARVALWSGGHYEIPKKTLRKLTFEAFIFPWMLASALVLLPGQLWMFPMGPTLVVSVIRYVRTYPCYEDFGISARRYAGWHLLAYLIGFTLGFTIKFAFLE